MDEKTFNATQDSRIQAGTPLSRAYSSKNPGLNTGQLRHSMGSGGTAPQKALPTLTDIMAGITQRSGGPKPPEKPKAKEPEQKRAYNVSHRQTRHSAAKRQEMAAAQAQKDDETIASTKAPRSLEGRSMQIQDRVAEEKGQPKKGLPGKKPGSSGIGSAIGTDKLLRLQRKAADQAKKRET